MLLVGSGGSLTSAHFASFLHSRFTGRLSQTLTPYELASVERTLDESAVLFCSAGGRNPDVIAAAELVIKRAPAQLIALTMRRGSPLERELDRTGWAACHAFSAPTKKDGFLATNSLLATLVLLTRAYEQSAGARSSLPATLDELLHRDATRAEFIGELRAKFGPLMNRSTLVVLHGAATKPAAMDFESRFTEAALAGVQTADYRNFAHGRHHWLARHGSKTAVLAFAEDGDKIAGKTLALVPTAIPRWKISVESSVPGALAAVCHSLLLALVAGEACEMDPGRPHIPTFGRKLYHLRAMPELFPGSGVAEQRMNLAIERKTRLPLAVLAARGQLDEWLVHYRAFVNRLGVARIRAIVVDYDGTLCGPERRLTGPSGEIATRVNAILSAGFTVAVATGRGKSVREALRKHITSASSRKQVIVGYHNGAEIGPLSDSGCPPAERPLAPNLASVAAALRESAVIARHATVDAKGDQIAIELHSTGDACAVFRETVRLAHACGTCGGLTVVTSSHSVDVIAHGVCKSSVVKHLMQRLGLSEADNSSILCIGDRGREPGNDADLLRNPLSLSVDEVSDDPSTCWILATPGLRFDLACLEYLSRLRPTKQGLRFDVKGIRP